MAACCTNGERSGALPKSTFRSHLLIWRVLCVFVWLLVGLVTPSCSKNSEGAQGLSGTPDEQSRAEVQKFELAEGELDLSLPDKTLEYTESPSRLEQLSGSGEAGSLVIEPAQASDNKNKSKNKVSISPSLEWEDDSLPTVSGGEILLQRQLEN